MRSTPMMAAFVLCMAAESYPQRDRPIELCAVFKDFRVYRDRLIVLRGVPISTSEVTGIGAGRRCTSRFRSDGFEWPAVLWLSDSRSTSVEFVSEPTSPKVQKALGQPISPGMELWVTVEGKLLQKDTYPIVSTPKGMRGFGFGHLGQFPGTLVVKRVIDVQVRKHSVE